MFVNARMYSVTPEAALAWRSLFDWVLDRAGISAKWVDHDPPKPISELWARDDLLCAQMCGLPYSLRVPNATLLAAPVPSLPSYNGQSNYWSYIAVKASSTVQTLQDTFGSVAGYTVKDSQSGYFAFRHHLLGHAPNSSQYKKIVGGLVNPRGVISALVDGRIDVGPLDSYVFDLIRAGDPAFANQVKIIDRTSPTPMPPIVTTIKNIDPLTVSRLRNAFLFVEHETSLEDIRKTLLISRFIIPDAASFKVLKERHDRVNSECTAW